MQAVIKALLVASLLVYVHGQSSSSALPGCFLPKACGGTSKVKFSASIPSKVINGVTVAFFACQCVNGTRFAVNSDATIMIPLAKVPAQAPTARPVAPSPATIAISPIAPAGAPKPILTPPRADGFNPSLFAANLATAHPAECSAINRTLLNSPISDPRACNRTLAIGQRCWSTCRFAMRALGEDCYKVAVAVGVADPTKVRSNATVAFDQCTRDIVYTTADKWKPAVDPVEPPAKSPAAESPAGEPGTEEGSGEVAPSQSSGVQFAPQAMSLVILCFMVFV